MYTFNLLLAIKLSHTARNARSREAYLAW